MTKINCYCKDCDFDFIWDDEEIEHVDLCCPNCSAPFGNAPNPEKFNKRIGV